MKQSRTLTAMMLAPALLAGAAVMAGCEDEFDQPLDPADGPQPLDQPADPAPQPEQPAQDEPADDMDDLDDLLGD